MRYEIRDMRYEISQIGHYLISCIFYLISLAFGEKKKSLPLTDQGWDTSVFHGSTLVTAAAVTHCRFNGRTRCGISAHTAQKWYPPRWCYRCLAPKWHPLWESYRRGVSSSQPFSKENLAHSRKKVNPPGKKVP